jgi:hypothetical protein
MINDGLWSRVCVHEHEIEGGGPRARFKEQIRPATGEAADSVFFEERNLGARAVVHTETIS